MRHKALRFVPENFRRNFYRFEVNLFDNLNNKLKTYREAEYVPFPFGQWVIKIKPGCFLGPYKDNRHILEDTIKLIKDWCVSPRVIMVKF